MKVIKDVQPIFPAMYDNAFAGSYKNALSLLKNEPIVQQDFPLISQGVLKNLSASGHPVFASRMWQAASDHRDPDGRMSGGAPVSSMTRHQDHFLNDRPMQPKKEVADYLESQGILVPKRFSNFQEALLSGQDFIIRSEHPQEYAGVSGLLESFSVSQELIQNCLKRDLSPYSAYTQGYQDFVVVLCQMIHGEIDEAAFWQKLAQICSGRILFYCKFYNIPENDFCREVSFTYWKKIPGQNITIVEDPAVSGRYHIFNLSHSIHVDDDSRKRCVDVPRTTIYTFENGRIYNEMVQCEILPRHVKHAQSLVQLYERVRGLDCFEKNHCPIIEIQYTPDGQFYVLQSHRGRNRQDPTAFQLAEMIQDQNVIEAAFVCGATPTNEPIELKVYAGRYRPHSDPRKAGLRRGIEMKYEVMFRIRDLDLVVIGSYIKGTNWNPLDYMSVRMNSPHEMFSTLIKPRFSVVVDFKDRDYLNNPTVDELEQARKIAEQTGQEVHVYTSVYIVSDGTRAFLFKKS